MKKKRPSEWTVTEIEDAVNATIQEVHHGKDGAVYDGFRIGVKHTLTIISMSDELETA